MILSRATDVSASRFPDCGHTLNSITSNSLHACSNFLVLNNSGWHSSFPSTCLKPEVLTFGFKRKPILQAKKGARREDDNESASVYDENVETHDPDMDFDMEEEEMIISSLDSVGSNVPNVVKSEDYVREIELLLSLEEKAILDQNKAPKLARISTEKWNLFHSLLLSGQIDYVNVLFPSSIDLDLADKDGLTVLHKAIIHRRIPLVMHLLKRGANLHVKDLDGATPLHYAAQIGCLNMVKLLVQYKADLNAEDVDGWTALHVAVQTRNIDIVTFLLSKGADRTRRNKNGRRALDLCLAYGERFKTYHLAQVLKFVAVTPTVLEWWNS